MRAAGIRQREVLETSGLAAVFGVWCVLSRGQEKGPDRATLLADVFGEVEREMELLRYCGISRLKATGE